MWFILLGFFSLLCAVIFAFTGDFTPLKFWLVGSGVTIGGLMIFMRGYENALKSMPILIFNGLLLWATNYIFTSHILDDLQNSGHITQELLAFGVSLQTPTSLLLCFITPLVVTVLTIGSIDFLIQRQKHDVD